MAAEDENASDTQVEENNQRGPFPATQPTNENEADVGPPPGHAFPIVGIGASAGGLDALMQILKVLPDDTGMAFVFVQHLDPHHGSQLAEILAPATAMPICTVTDGTAVSPNALFVIPPNTTMVLEDGVLRLSGRPPGLHLPIDAFFESLARVQRSRAIGVVLSGNASDGSQGVKAIKQECGLTFAQAEGTAQHVGMPRNAIATGAIDYVLSPAEIARELSNVGHHPFLRPSPPDQADMEVLPQGDGELRKIFSLLQIAAKVDFTHYKINTIRRRISRRMIVTRTRNLRQYLRLLEKTPEEVHELYRDLLISVTSFFRDAAVFERLLELLKDTLLSRNSTEPFRVWVPGCATGEELYSIAICLRELTDDVRPNTALQLFGTDISEMALDFARTGVYPDSIAQNVSPERLRRFFLRVERGYQVSKSTREICVFARQDVSSDPPFGHIDLVSCRNLLIYMDSELQRRILPLFHYSLNPTGMLLLGSAESVGKAEDLFSVIDRENRIYGRKSVPLRLTLPRLTSTRSGEASERGIVHSTLSGIDLQKKADLVIQSKYSPASVVIDSNNQILHFRGRTGFFLEPPPGEATLNLLRMARESLIIPLRKALQAAASQNISVCETGIVLEHEHERREVKLEVTPIAGATPNERYYLVVFEERPVSVDLPAAPSAESLTGEASGVIKLLEARVANMQQQLAELREQLRNAHEDHEAGSEELRAANEEVRSANEELQSSNEELSTTKEELQSANEELNTLNEELQNRNRDLDGINNDLLNLLSAVDIPFLMVDNEFRLRRFSTAAERVLNVKAFDIGHPVTHLEGPINLKAFQEPLRRVVETLVTERWELQDQAGHWFSATVRPYRTTDNRISGAVLVLADIDPLKRVIHAAEEARNYAEGIIETARQPMLVVDGDLRIQRATSAFYETFQVARGETEGRLVYDLGNGQWNVPRLREAIGRALFLGQAFQDLEIQHVFPHIGLRTMRLNARRIDGTEEGARRVLLAIQDVTQRREEAEIRYRRLFETAKDGMLLFDAETERLTDVNPFFLEITGYGRERMIGCRLDEIEAFQPAQQQVCALVSQAVNNEVVRYDELPLRTANGGHLEIELVANRYSVGGQQVVQANVRDVTKRNETFQALRESEERFRLFVDSVRDYALFQMDLQGSITSWNSGAERLLGYRESEILGRSAQVLFTPEDVADGQAAGEFIKARENGSSEDERWHVRKDGSRFFASGVLTSVRDEAGQLRGFAKIMRDITERMKAQEQLRQQADLLDQAQDIIIVRGLDGIIAFWNEAASAAFGMTKEEAQGKDMRDLLRTDFSLHPLEVERHLLTKGRWEGELIHKRRDSSPLPVWSRWTLRCDAAGNPVSVLQIESDMTARKLADQQVRESLREKEVLLKEVHHRVKNNLQVIASLLSLQSGYLDEPKALAMLADMQNRVRSIAAIHEMLYGSANLSRIDFADYLNLMAKDLTLFYSADPARIRVHVQAQQVFLDITQALPCGLIVSELLSNSFKYAFPADRSGSIHVDFKIADGQYTLEFSDDGIGLPAGVELQNSASMGLHLVMLLVQQLKGHSRWDSGQGMRFTVVFSPKSQI